MTVGQDGQTSISIKACDLVENCATNTFTVKIDTTPPSFASRSPNGSTTWAKSRDITITYNDTYSGVVKIYRVYTTSSSGTTPSSNMYQDTTNGSIKNTLTHVGKYYLSTYAVDAVGNTSAVVTSPVYYIDNTAPYLSSRTSNGSSGYARSYSVTATYTDSYSGVGSVEY